MRIRLDNDRMWMHIFADWTGRYRGPTSLCKVLSKVRSGSMLYYSYLKLCGGRDPSVELVNRAFRDFLGEEREKPETGTGRILRYFGEDLYEVE